jgi:hypothetical protein
MMREALAVVLSLINVVGAQDPAAAEAEGNAQIARLLTGFARSAEGWKAPRRARLKKAEVAKALPVATEAIAADALPAPLRQSGLPFGGAKSKRFTIWSVDGVEDAAGAAVQAERTWALLEAVMPSASTQLRPGAIRWLAILRDSVQRDQLLTASPETCGKDTLELAKQCGSGTFEVAGGRAEWSCFRLEERDDDMAAWVTQRFAMWPFNEGLGIGVVHAASWLMAGTTHTYYFQFAPTAAGGPSLSRNVDDWWGGLRDEIDLGKDWPLRELPHERLTHVRDSARLKAWSFMVWLMARHPDDWVELGRQLNVENLTSEQVDAPFIKTLGREAADVEAEWREWMRRDSAVGRACKLPR